MSKKLVAYFSASGITAKVAEDPCSYHNQQLTETGHRATVIHHTQH